MGSLIVTIIYIDPSAATNGTGSFANPYNTDAGLTAKAGDTVLYKTGTTKQGRIPSTVNAAGNITIAEYGTGAKPIIDVGTVITMTASGTAGIFQYTFGSNVGGNVQIDGVVQRWVEWDTNLATTAAEMTEGSFTYDYNNNILYCKPVGGTITGKTVKASSDVNAISGSGVHFNTVKNLEIWQPSKHAIVQVDSHGVTIDNITMRLCGGYYDTANSFYAGNGAEIGGSSVDALVKNCDAYDIFDSAYTSQLYSNQVGAQYARNHQYDDNQSFRCGYSAFEFATLDFFQTLTGVYVNRPHSRDAGTSKAWGARAGKGNALSVTSAAGLKGGVDRVYVDSPDFQDSNYGIRNSYTTRTLTVTGKGRITGNITNRVIVDQFGSPVYARAKVALDENIDTDGSDSLGGYSDALVIFE